MQEKIEHAAQRAAVLTRQEYEAEGLHKTVMCYDLARDAARDRGYALCVNIDVDPRPTNVGAALLRMIDDMRALAGHPRVHQESYRPQVIVN
jgi:hypothetical protein